MNFSMSDYLAPFIDRIKSRNSFWQSFAIGGLIACALVSPVIFFTAGYLSIPTDRIFMQSEIIRLHGDLNQSETAQAELLATVDAVDRDAYWTGFYNHCVYDKGVMFEESCWEATEKEMGR